MRKVWRQLARDGKSSAQCTVVRLMKAMDLKGVRRCKTTRTTISNKAAPCPLIGGGRPAPDRAAFYNTGLSRYLDFMDSYLARAASNQRSRPLRSKRRLCDDG